MHKDVKRLETGSFSAVQEAALERMIRSVKQKAREAYKQYESRSS